MRVYTLESVLPRWHFDPPTIRQLKVLRFFGRNVGPISKGVCSGIIGHLLSNPTNKRLWAAYVYSTGDEDDTTSELRPHDQSELAKINIPKDWRPKQPFRAKPSEYHPLEQLVAQLLQDGSPFDDPLPDVAIRGRTFCFTGKFDFGTEKQCHAAVTEGGGLFSGGVTRKTDVLVVGNGLSPTWAHDGFGNKIERAMILRIQHGRPNIIPELLWQELLRESSGDVRATIERKPN